MTARLGQGIVGSDRAEEGTMVEVVHGPLAGVIGRLVRKGAHARLVLSVDLIGRAVMVTVDAADVRAY